MNSTEPVKTLEDHYQARSKALWGTTGDGSMARVGRTAKWLRTPRREGLR